MTREELRQVIVNCWNDVVFTYNDKASGVTSEVHDSVPTFQVWHGDDYKYYSDVDVLMADRFYSGKSINELIETVEFWVL